MVQLQPFSPYLDLKQEDFLHPDEQVADPGGARG